MIIVTKIEILSDYPHILNRNGTGMLSSLKDFFLPKYVLHNFNGIEKYNKQH